MPVAKGSGTPSLVLPFRGEQYPNRTLSRLIAPPYDVIGREDRERLAARSRHNIVHLLLPTGGSSRYKRAAGRLQAWREAGILQRGRRPGIAVVRQSFRVDDGPVQHRTGAIGAVAVESFGAGRVRPHEKTHAEPKADRLALLRATGTVFDALFMLNRDEDGDLRHLLEDVTVSPASAHAELDGVSIDLWMTFGEAAEAIAAAASHGALYIADGHHRYETALAFRQESPQADRTLSLIVPLGDRGLVVLSTHRVIHGRPIEQERLLSRLRGCFQVREVAAMENLHRIVEADWDQGTVCALVLPGRVFQLVLREGSSLGEHLAADHPSVASLDVARADALVVGPAREIAGEASGLTYTPNATELQRRLESAEAVAGILLKPPRVEQVLAVADAGAAMPQKSTYFMPKVPSGLVLLPVSETLGAVNA